MKNGRRRILYVFLLAFGPVVGAMLAIVENVAASEIPTEWKPYLWLVWPALIVLVLISIGVGVYLYIHSSEPDDEESQNHRKAYLLRLRRQLGFVNLSKIAESEKDIPLENIYIPLPTDLAFTIRVKDYRIVAWWLTKAGDISEDVQAPVNEILGPRVQLGVFQKLVERFQQFINEGKDRDYSSPTERPLILAPPWYDGVKPAFWPLYVMDAVAAVDRLVILGPPGSGKSTSMRHLALYLAARQLGNIGANTNEGDLTSWPHENLTPLYIELRHFVGWSKFPPLNQTVSDEHFWLYVQEQILTKDLAPFGNALRSDLLEGKAMLIFDGIDEIPIPPGENALTLRRKQIQELMRALTISYPGVHIACTARSYGYEGWELDGFTSLSLSPLTSRQMQELATKLYQQKRGEHAAVREANALLAALIDKPDSLKDRPLFLTMLALVYMNSGGVLPASKAELYYKVIMLLLDRWTQDKVEEPSLADLLGCSIDELYKRLEVVAYKTQESISDAISDPNRVDMGLLLSQLFKIPSAKLHNLVAFLSQQSGVLVSLGADHYQFAHRSFQEYLAASYIVHQGSFQSVREQIESYPITWREPALLTGQELIRGGRSSEIWDLLDVLLDNDLPSELTGNDVRRWSTWLAGRLACDCDLPLANPGRRNSEITRSLRGWLELVISTSGNPLLKERVDIGDALGRVGDNRPGVGLQNGLPDIKWCTIPAGEFLMGITPTQIDYIRCNEWGKGQDDFSRESPYKSLPLSGFQISRYPVTEVQFQAFRDADDGYHDPQWWSPAGRDFLDKRGVASHGQPTDAETDQGYLGNYPAVYISWHEALAFCNWLSHKLNYRITLPSEAQWEKAARGTDGRLYPWGDDFDSNLCNSQRSGVNRVCAVGCIPLENGPWGTDGPLDMSGNIWEWCSTIYEKEGNDRVAYPYDATDGREELDVGDECFRVVRGGSYLNVPFVVRTTFRGRDRPFSQYGREGFRLVAEL